MNWVDIIIIILVLGLAFMGWRQGVIKLVFTLVGLILGIVLAGRLWKQVADVLPIGNESLARIAGFIVVLAVVMIAAWLSARIAKTILKALLLGWVDGLAGAAIGALIGAVAATAIVSAAGIVPSDSIKGSVQDSTLAQPLVENMGVVYSLLPDEFSEVKDLVGRASEVFDGAAALLEQSGQLQQLIGQGSQLLEQAGGMQDLIDKAKGLLDGDSSDGAVIGFNGLSDFTGDEISAMVDDGSGELAGPLTATVLTGGVAVLGLDGLESDTAYTVSYYVDGNTNGTCDETDVDVKGTVELPAGATEAGVSYSGDPGLATVCEAFE